MDINKVNGKDMNKMECTNKDKNVQNGDKADKRERHWYTTIVSWTKTPDSTKDKDELISPNPTKFPHIFFIILILFLT